MKQLGRYPTDEEWAAAAGVDLLIMRRRLALGRAARTKLIQVIGNTQAIVNVQRVLNVYKMQRAELM